MPTVTEKNPAAEPARRKGRYPKEFRRDAVALAIDQHRTVVDVARELGVVEQLRIRCQSACERHRAARSFDRSGSQLIADNTLAASRSTVVPVKKSGFREPYNNTEFVKRKSRSWS